MAKDALKFFQAYLREMVDVGGENLPRAISTKLGTKLGQVYEKKGLTDGFERALKQIYIALGAKPKITKVNEGDYEISVKHSNKWCPIGGDYSPKNAKLFQKNVCIPYTLGFLNQISPDKFEIDIEQCILETNKSVCEYCLKKAK